MRINFKENSERDTDILNISYQVFITIIAIKCFYDIFKLSFNAVII
jgi:hypothetical protein